MAEMTDLIECNYKDNQSLYLAYMPFVKGGGLFIRTSKKYDLGDKLSVSIQLPNESEPYAVEGKIIWITPKEARGNKPIGIGIQFSGNNGSNLCNKIETLLADMLKSTKGTDTI
jgi:type IV pilus assembly protein PilZ